LIVGQILRYLKNKMAGGSQPLQLDSE
jgi:hypothetical protein